MDRDHAALERMFADVARTPDDGLPELFEAIARELAKHFAREEAAMTEARVPVLASHLDLHAQLLRELEKMRPVIGSHDAEAARELMGAILPQLVEHHVATADAVSASFLRG
jgi:hemerythrin-like metal-binding protein